MPSGKLLLFKIGKETACVSEFDWHLVSKQNFELVGDCLLETSERRGVEGGMPMGCCNQSNVASRDNIRYSTHPELFEKVTVTNHAATPQPLIGKVSGRSYSLRRNGEVVAVLKTDIEAEPEKYESLP